MNPGWTKNTPNKFVASWDGTRSASRSRIPRPIPPLANRPTTRVIASSRFPLPHTPPPCSLRSIAMGAGLPTLCQTRKNRSFSTGHHLRLSHRRSLLLVSQHNHSNMQRSTAFLSVTSPPKLPTRISSLSFATRYSACVTIVNPNSLNLSRVVRVQKLCWILLLAYHEATDSFGTPHTSKGTPPSLTYHA